MTDEEIETVVELITILSNTEIEELIPNLPMKFIVLVNDFIKSNFHQGECKL